MGCWHGWHGCGPRYGPAYGPEWNGPADWYGPAEWVEEPPRARPRRRYRRPEEAGSGEDLEARLAQLLDEVRRVEARLIELRGPEDVEPER